ncbi:MAG: PilZ domain-containing protein [Bdellovibrionota bacterium]
MERNLLKERRLKTRHRIKLESKAIIRLFGSKESYELQTENVSESGLLLTSKINRLSHMNAASILEVSLFIEKENPINFLAKWVRNHNDYSVGIMITDIEAEEQKRLSDFIADLSDE